MSTTKTQDEQVTVRYVYRITYSDDRVPYLTPDQSRALARFAVAPKGSTIAYLRITDTPTTHKVEYASGKYTR